MAKRPSYVSIRARQRKLLEYIGSTGRSNRQAAKDIGVSPRSLDRFINTNAKDLKRKGYSKKLYDAANEKRLRQVAKAHGNKVEFRPLREYSEAEIQAVRKTPGYSQEYKQRYAITGEQVQHLYTQEITPQYLWAVYTQEKGLPVSIRSIQLLRRNNRISDAEYRDVLTVWKDIYNVQADRYASFIG